MSQRSKHPRAILILWIAGLSLWGAFHARSAEPESMPDGPQHPPAAATPGTPPRDAITRKQAKRIITGLNTTSRNLGGWVDGIARRSGPDWMNAPSFLGISGTRYLASFLLLVLVAAFAGMMVRTIRIHAGRIDEKKEQSWPRMLLSAVRKPLALTIWIYGVFLAIGILVDAMETGAGLAGYPRFFSGLTYGGLTIASFWLIFRLIRGTERKLRAWAERSEGILDNVLVPVIGTALRLLVPLVGLFILLGSTELPAPFERVMMKMLTILLIGCLAYLVIRATTVSEKALLKAHRLDVADNLRAREIYTQVSVIRKIIVVSTLFLAGASMLMLFQPVRQLGTSILASAGIAGVVLGFAAQKTLSNLFAGIQIAISQPIRIDDVVIVEGEWGRIENITLTFVTVCIWDLRRLVLPINYFIEKPFQNWTRNSADLLNSVFIYADYTLPVEPLRQELKRLLDASPLWDRKAWVLQVTDSTPQAMEIRCLMTSSDAPKGWDLKCEIREGLVRFIQTQFPECLPRVRAELHRVEQRPEPAANPLVKTDEGVASSSPGLEVGPEPR